MHLHVLLSQTAGHQFSIKHTGNKLRFHVVSFSCPHVSLCTYKSIYFFSSLVSAAPLYTLFFKSFNK